MVYFFQLLPSPDLLYFAPELYLSPPSNTRERRNHHTSIVKIKKSEAKNRNFNQFGGIFFSSHGRTVGGGYGGHNFPMKCGVRLT